MGERKIMKKTNETKVLDYLNEHGSITQLDAIFKFDAPYTRLSDGIYKLKKKGYPIDTVMEKNESTGKVYARYYLRQSA